MILSCKIREMFCFSSLSPAVGLVVCERALRGFVDVFQPKNCLFLKTFVWRATEHLPLERILTESLSLGWYMSRPWVDVSTTSAGASSLSVFVVAASRLTMKTLFCTQKSGFFPTGWHAWVVRLTVTAHLCIVYAKSSWWVEHSVRSEEHFIAFSLLLIPSPISAADQWS